MMQLFLLHMCGLNSHAILQHVDVASLPINYNEIQLLDIKRPQVYSVTYKTNKAKKTKKTTVTLTGHDNGGKQNTEAEQLTSIREGLDVVGQVNIHTIRIVQFFEADSNKPHGNKFIPVKKYCANL